MNRKVRRAQEKLATKAPMPAPVRPGIDPRAAALNTQAIEDFTAGRREQALQKIDQALALDAKVSMHHSNKGEMLRMMGQIAAALECFNRAIELDADNVKALNNRGNALRALRRVDEAMADYKRSLELEPNQIEAWNNLGNWYQERNDRVAALDCYRRAVSIDPNNAMAQHNLGLSLESLGRREEAEAAFAIAIKLNPKLGQAQLAMGDIQRKRGDIGRAQVFYERAGALTPEDAEARIRIGLTLLAHGDYQRGFEEFSYRWQLASMSKDHRPFPQARWDGEALPAGKSLLVQTEQGIGEQMLFLPLLIDLMLTGAKPILECEYRMAPLLRRSFPDLEIIQRADPPSARLLAPDIAAQTALGELPRFFRKKPADCTGLLVLQANRDHAAALRMRYQNQGSGRLVGIAWRSANPELGAPKSAPLSAYLPFLQLPGLRFVDLQYGDTGADRAAIKAESGIDILHDDSFDQLRDLDSFAAQVMAMDLIITTSNSTAHMAAALGKPVWLLLPKAITPHWYWGLSGDTTPWYPTLRIFRQGEDADWQSLANRVAGELKVKKIAL